jgi:hypothetical protein
LGLGGVAVEALERVLPAAELVETLVAEAQEVLGRR